MLTRSNFDSPSVVLSGYLPAGSLFDPLEKLGLAHFTALALMRGTQRYNFQQIFDALESAGASLGFGASVHNTSFGGARPGRRPAPAAELLSEALRSPVFPPEQVERLRGQILTGLAIRDQDTGDRCEMAFEETIFPDHPYGLPSDGHPETIRSITRDDLVEFHQRTFGPRGCTIVVVGAVEPDQAVERVRRALGDWRNPAQAPAPLLPPVQPLSSTIRRANCPARQSADRPDHGLPGTQAPLARLPGGFAGQQHPGAVSA